MNGHDATQGFALKCMMKANPIKVLLSNLILSMIVFGYSLRIFDQDYKDASGQNFDKVSNPFWMSIITMTTVGYGDFFPKSFYSRLIGLICAFYGVYLVSLFVVVMDNFLIMNSGQERAYDLLESLES